MSIRNWSTTASSNNSAPPNGWPEGQAPSSVNNVGRQMMADIRETLEALPYFDFGHTPTRVDADTFTVATDLTAVYTAGKQLKFVGSTTEYAIVTSSSYSAPDTTVEVSGTVPTSLSTVSVSITAQPEYRRTAAEIAAGVTPTNYAIPSHTACDEVRIARYGTLGAVAATNNTIIQNAMLVAFECGCPITFPDDAPKPCYVTGLTHIVDTADRDKTLWFRGAGYGEPFATGKTVGAVIERTTDGPVLSVTSSGASGSSVGTIRSEGIYWIADSTTSAVYIEALYGQSYFNRNIVFQNGTGNGLQIDYMGTSEVCNNYVLNGDWVTFSLGAARTGIGIYIRNQIDSGLQVVKRNTSRGFLSAYKFGDASGFRLYAMTIAENECSVCYNGMLVTSDVRGAYIYGNYMEGGEGGTALLDEGDYNHVERNFIFSGFLVGIDQTAATKGNTCRGNLVAAGSVANTKLIKITDNGGYKVCSDNHMSFSGAGGSIAGVVGLTLAGSSPFIDLSSNSFDSTSWGGGAGTMKISDTSTGGGVIGYSMANESASGSIYPMISRGGVSLFEGALLEDASVTANVQTFTAPYHVVTCGSAQTITSLSGPSNPDCRFVQFRTTNANASYTDSASLVMDGGVTFTGPGLIEFFIDSSVAYETRRNTF